MSPSMQLDLSCLDPPSLAAPRKGAVSAAACPDEAAVGGGGVGGVPSCFPLPAVQDVRCRVGRPFFFSCVGRSVGV